MTNADFQHQFEEAADKLLDAAEFAIFMMSKEETRSVETARELKQACNTFRNQRRGLFEQRRATLSVECVDGEGHRPSDVLKLNGRPTCRACGALL